MRGIRIHAGAFAAGAFCLGGTNWLSGSPWWSFWPIALWAVALAGHYLIYKARTVDERWVEERTADLHSKSYDASHIDSIVARYDEGTPKPPEKPK